MARFRFFWAVVIPGFCLLSVIVSAPSFLRTKNLTAFLSIKRNRLKNQTGLMLFARNNGIYKFYLNEFLRTIFGSITFTFGPEKYVEQ